MPQTLASMFAPLFWGANFVLIIIAFALIARKSKVAKGIGYVIGIIPVFLISGSLLGWGVSWHMEWSTERDFAYFEELCKAQAGDKIYKTVEGVEGIFQMRPREKNSVARSTKTGFDDYLADQYGMEDPYGFAIGDQPHFHELLLDPSPSSKYLRYGFVETPQDHSSKTEPLYRYFAAVSTGFANKYGDQNVPQVRIEEKSTGTRQSRYGYTWQDISTRDMRDKWIAGGKITIIDLRTNDVLAERTGFVFARHRNGELDKYPWGGSPHSSICPSDKDGFLPLIQFIQLVLRPAH
jgi:hypothetical protein